MIGILVIMLFTIVTFFVRSHVESESTNTSWDTDIHYVKIFRTYIKCVNMSQNVIGYGDEAFMI